MNTAAVEWLENEYELALSAREKIRQQREPALTDAERSALHRWSNGIVANAQMFCLKTDTNEKPMRWHATERPGPLDGEPHP